MNLYQFLRYIKSDTKIVVYDIQNICICKVNTKQEIPVDFYEYDVLNISVQFIEGYWGKTGYLCITIQK